MRFFVVYNLTKTHEHTVDTLIVNTTHNTGEHVSAHFYNCILTIQWKEMRAGKEQAESLGVKSP